MKASKIGLLFASLLLAGLFSGAAYAACPCVGDPVAKECADPESNPPHGPNGCTNFPTGLVGTDGVGCIEAGALDRGGEEDDCTACIGGVIDEDPDTGNRVLLLGCACTLNPAGGWICVSTTGVEIGDDGLPIIPPIPPAPVEPELVASPLDGMSMCEIRAADACMLND